MSSNASVFACGTAAWVGAIKVLGMERGTLLGNVGWFGAATWFFGQPHLSVNWVVPKSERSNVKMVTMIKSAIGFLGGMNGGMFTLNLLLLASNLARKGELFAKASEKSMLFFSFALAHFSQFYFQEFNPPGILFYIYYMDLAQALVNLKMALQAKDD